MVYKHWNYTITILLFFTGLIIMLVSTIIYYLHRGMYSHTWLQSNYVLSLFLTRMKLSFSEIRNISTVGEIFVLYSLIALCFSAFSFHKRFYLIFSLMLPIYFLINTPSCAYYLALALNSSSANAFINAQILYNILLCIKLIIVSIFMTTPHIILIYMFIKKKFLVARRNILILFFIFRKFF